MSQLVRIPFRDDEILTTEIGGRPHVILKPAFDAIGLDADRQIKKVQQQPWARTAVTDVRGSDGRHRQMITADLRTFLMSLATVPAARVAKEIQPKLIAYQCEVADVIESYWTRGHAINPRVEQASMFEPHTLSWDETAALIAQRFGIDMTVNDLCRSLRTAGVLKQTGAPTKAHRALFWFTGSAWNVHPHAVKQLAMKVYQTGRELQDFRFMQVRLEFGDDGVTGALDRR